MKPPYPVQASPPTVLGSPSYPPRSARSRAAPRHRQNKTKASPRDHFLLPRPTTARPASAAPPHLLTVQRSLPHGSRQPKRPQQTPRPARFFAFPSPFAPFSHPYTWPASAHYLALRIRSCDIANAAPAHAALSYGFPVLWVLSPPPKNFYRSLIDHDDVRYTRGMLESRPTSG